MQETVLKQGREVFSEKRVIDGVPVMMMEPIEGENLPVVFYLHGFGRCKEDGAVIGQMLAQSGIRAVSVDLYMHGAHTDRLPFPGMFPIVQHTTDDLRRLIDIFGEDAKGQIGIVGVSMGAMIAFHLAATEPAVRTVVSMIGNPDFEANFRRLSEVDKDLKWLSLKKKPLWRSMLAMGTAMNPKDRLENFHPKPLLMLNGRYDPFVELKHPTALYERLMPVYKDEPERLQLKVYEVAHEVTEEMNREAVAWFSRYLKVG
jgi:pimeloyl-ACP methyl ester carboxylesterase